MLSIDQALERAAADGLDLVEVNPMAKPPVCKIMDYGRFKYEEKKKTNEAKKKQVVVKVKEVKLRPKTEEHDYDFKIRNARTFIEEGNKAKITIMFRGREITHRELGTAVLDDVVQDLKDVAIVESTPRMEGRQMFMILSPNAKVAQKARDQHRQALQEAEKAKAARAKEDEEKDAKDAKDDTEGKGKAPHPAASAPTPADAAATPTAPR